MARHTNLIKSSIPFASGHDVFFFLFSSLRLACIHTTTTTTTRPTEHAVIKK